MMDFKSHDENIAELDCLIEKQATDAELDAKPTFEDLCVLANNLNEESEPEKITELINKTRLIDLVSRRKINEVIKEKTKLPFKILEDYINESGEIKDCDQLKLAHHVQNEIGIDNIISAESFVWLWQDEGVWTKQEDRGVKQVVQHHITAEVNSVNRMLVDGVTEVFKNAIFKQHHKFNVGMPDTVNCLSGELMLDDVSDWVLTAHNRENYRTTQIPVNYNSGAIAPQFTEFLYSVFKGDHDANDKKKAVLEMMGYSLMAHCRHEKFVILIGSGANGKSVLLSVLEALVGRNNTAAVQPSQFDNRFQRAHLDGKLVNIVSELKQGAVIDDDALKGITSGESTTVEHKHQNPFDMRPFSTCWFGTNHMPHTRDFSDALFRRAVLLQFNNKFSPELGNMNPKLKEELIEELEGILIMALTAYSEAISSGFTTPDSTKSSLDLWRLEADQVAQFVDEECTIRPDKNEPSTPLYKAYQDWATESGIKQLVNNRNFKERLGRLGIESQRKEQGIFYTGIECRRLGR